MVSLNPDSATMPQTQSMETLHVLGCCSEAAEGLLASGGTSGDHTQHVETHGLGQRPGQQTASYVRNDVQLD